MKLTAWQTLVTIIAITAIGVAAIVTLEIAGLDITPVVALISPTLVVLVGLVKLDSAQAERTNIIGNKLDENSKRIGEVADATNGKLDTALAIVAANQDKEGETDNGA